MARRRHVLGHSRPDDTCADDSYFLDCHRVTSNVLYIVFFTARLSEDLPIPDVPSFEIWPW